MFSILLTVYNEEKGIQRVLDYLNLHRIFIDDIVIVSDGSTDKTNSIIQNWMQKTCHEIKFIKTFKRVGRAEVIKLGLSKVSHDLVISLSGDIELERDCIKNILPYFHDSKVGLVSGKALLLNNHRSIADCLGHVIWESHNQTRETLSKQGKVIHASGDVMAFRKSALIGFERYTGVVEDAAMSLIVNRNGFKTLFASDVNYHVFYPSSIKDFIRTRKRTCYGRMELARKYGLSSAFYDLNTKEYIVNLVKATHFKLRNILSLCFGFPLEMLLRLYYSVKSSREENVLDKFWKPSTSTKW